jgi:iron complex transport system ATP-binding protein
MTPLLEIKNLTLQTGNKLLCHDLSLQIQPGEIWGILGPNGSGKTTLLHTLAGLVPTVSGELFLEGKNIRFLSRKHIAQRIGILFQENHDIFPQTVWEICQSGRYPHAPSMEDQDIAKQALFDMDLDVQIHQFIQTLSGGERKRLSIATLLTQRPIIYLLDEPTNHLDLHHQVKILNHFKKISENKSASIIMSLHDVNIAAHYCHKLLLLGNGECISGNSALLLTDTILSNLYQHPIKQMNAQGDGKWWQPWLDCERATLNKD